MTKSLSFRADIQGLRAIAVILVLLFHFETGLRGGYLGVDMFFVISGFVIATSTLREVDLTNHFSLVGFLHRRIRRLLPGMAVMTIATSVLSMLLLSPFGPQKETAKMLLSAASYTSNFILMPQSYFSLDPKANPLLHLWSLAVEEQFYFIWPIAIMGFIKLRKRLHTNVFKVTIWVAVMAFLLASCWLFLMCSIHGSDVNDYQWFKPLIKMNITPEHFAFYSPFTRAWQFIAGVVVALFLRLRIASLAFKDGSIVTCSGAALVMLGVAWASKYPEIQHDLNWSTNTSATIATTVGTAMWIVGGSNNNIFQRLISVRPLTLIGDCSYSIYLIHWPVWVLLITSFKQNHKVTVLAFVLSIFLGWLQFRYIEEPIRSKKRFSKTYATQFVGVFGLVAVLGFAIMSYITPVLGIHLAGIKPNELSLHIIEKPCLGESFNFENAQSCIYESTLNSGNAVLVGDSMAKSISDGFVQAANAEGLNGYVFSYPGCAYHLADSPFTATNECVSWRSNVLSALQQLQPRVLIIANLSSLYVDPPLPDWDVPETQRIWGTQINRTAVALSELNTQVIFAQPPPLFAYDLRYDISLLWPNSVKESRDIVESRRSDLDAVEQSAIEGIGYVQPIFKFVDKFCDATICDPKIGGKFMLEDDSHLSVDGSYLISTRLQTAINNALAS